jgi:hypothetical protein
MITADQLIAHAVGDYLLQSDWMANNKTKALSVALVHALAYSLPFLFFRPSFDAFMVILVTHAAIDRWRLARFVVWAKNQVAPAYFRHRWADCNTTGYPKGRPDWLAVWLLIIADNVLHVLINGAALRFL